MQANTKMVVTVRPARTSDMSVIKKLMQPFVDKGILLGKDMVALYEATQEFLVATNAAGEIKGFGALHVMWEHFGEVRTLAVTEDALGQGIGHKLLLALEERAQQLGLKQLVSLTFETEFFGRHGYVVIGEDPAPVVADVYKELQRSHDEGVAEFLDLSRIKPNTLGNTRMMKTL